MRSNLSRLAILALLIIHHNAITPFITFIEINKQNVYNDSISNHSQSIYYRYYFNHRIKNIYEKLMAICPSLQDIDLSPLYNIKCNHSAVNEAREQLLEKKNNEPILQLLKHCKRYHFLHENFEQNIAQLLYLLCKAINNNIKKTSSEQSTDHILYDIETWIEENYTRENNDLTISDHIPHQVKIDDIAYNFYILKRLRRSFEILRYQNIYSDYTYSNTKNHLKFEHISMHNCFDEIVNTHSLNPILTLWKNYKKYRYAGDTLFLQEMLMGVFVIYRNLLLQLPNKNDEIEQEIDIILYYYEKINTISTEEILDAIDLATYKYLELTEPAETQNYWFQDLYQLMMHSFGLKKLKTIEIQEHTHLTLKRYYFIARLEKTIKLITRLSQKKNTNPDNLYHKISTALHENSFTHEKIQKSIERIFQTKSLKPLFMIWDEFNAYKGLKDDLFLEDFSKEIFVVTKVLYDKKNIVPLTKNMKQADYLCAIDKIIDYYEYELYNEESMINQPTKLIKDLKIALDSDEILYRFYHIHRIDYIATILHNLYKKNIIGKKNITTFIAGNNHYSHPYIKKILSKINHDQDINILFLLFDDFRQYRFVDDMQFSYEFCSLIKHICHTIQQQILPHKSAYIISNHEHMNMEELLNEIDLYAEKIEHITQSQINPHTFSSYTYHFFAASALLLSLGLYGLYYQ